MKLLLVFVSFLQIVAALLDYDQYKLAANEKNWPISNDAYEAYVAYCNNDSATTPPKFKGSVLTKDDCEICTIASPSASTIDEPAYVDVHSADCPAELTTTPLPDDRTTTIEQTSTSDLIQPSTEASTMNDKISTTEMASTTLETTQRHDTTGDKKTQPESSTTGSTLTTYETDTSLQETTKSIQEENLTSTTSTIATSTSTMAIEIQLSEDELIAIPEATCPVESTTTSETSEISTIVTTPVATEQTLSTILKISKSVEPKKTTSATEGSSTSMPTETTTFGVSTNFPSRSSQLPTTAKTNGPSTLSASTTKTTAKPTTTSTKTTQTTPSSHLSTTAKPTEISSTKATSPTTIPKSTASSSTVPPPTSSTTATKVTSQSDTLPPTPKTSPKTTKTTSTTTLPHITTEKTTTVTDKPTSAIVSSTDKSSDVSHTSTVTLSSTTTDSTNTVASTSTESPMTTATESTTSSIVRKTDTSPSSTVASTQPATQTVVKSTQSQTQTQTTSSGEILNERETTTTSSSTVTTESSYGQTTPAVDSTISTTATIPIGHTETEVTAVSSTDAQATTPQMTTEKDFVESRTTTPGAPKTSDVFVATTNAATETVAQTSTSDFKTTKAKIFEETSPTSTFSSTKLSEDTTLTETELIPADASTTQQSTAVEIEMPSIVTTTTTNSAAESSSSTSTLVSTTTSTTFSKAHESTSDAEQIPQTTTTLELKTTPGLEKTTSTQFNAPSTTDRSSITVTVPTTTPLKGSTEKTTQETTLPAKAIASTPAGSEPQQSTLKLTQKVDTLETTIHSTTATPTKTNATTTATTKSTTKSSPRSESATQSTSDPSTPPTMSSASSSERPTSTTQSSACKNACPSDFIEGHNACFKMLQPNTTDGWQFKDFENACTTENGIIASNVDFGYSKNMQIFKDMSQKSQSALVLTNTIPTKEYRTKKMVFAADLAGFNMASLSTKSLSTGQKYTNVSAFCRIGKFCETYTCPVLEYFMPETSQYLEAAVPSTTALKAGEKLTIQCTVTPKRSFNVKCDTRGYLTPDSSMIKCGSDEIIQSEEDGVVSSCDACDKFQTSSCDNLGNGSYYCSCKELFYGKSCRYPLNACQNVTCENAGTCKNRFTYAYCQCQTSFFGEFCQHNFYNSDEAWTMRFMVNVAAVAVIAEQVVRAKKRATPSINGKSGVLPTEISRYMALFFGTFALMFRIMLEFPENDSPPEMASCADYFSIMITCVFFALTAMIGESIISLGIIQNQTTNQFRGQFRRRRNCVKPGKFYYLIAFFGFLAPVILWQYSENMVTPRSCVGVVPWPNMAPETQYAGVALVTLLGIYALTGTGLAILARFWINHQAYATRRRYDAEFSDPWAYGKEVFPVEINVRYCLLAIRPTLFVICWCAFIIAAEQMEWWATWTAMGCSCLYSAVSCVQNFTTIADDLDSTMEFFMKWAPERWAPTYNYITLRIPDEYLQVKNLEKYRNNQEKKLNGGPAICYPIPFDQKIERLLRTSDPNVQNSAAIHSLIPTGLQNQVIKNWKKIYIKNRAAEKTPWDAMKEVWRDVHDTRPATIDIAPQAFVALFRNFKTNMGHWDRFDHKDPIAKKIYERGAETLSIMPTYKIQTAEIWKPKSNFKKTVSFFHGDPLLNFDQQQAAYNYLEKVCKSISAEDIEKNEFETAEFINNRPDLCGRHRDILTAQVVNNHRWTLHDFLLDELRPNFIGPRSYENQLAPGVTPLDDIAYYWMKVGEETWKRIQIQSKYESFNEAAHSEFNLWRGFLPWNLFKRYDDENGPIPDDAADFLDEFDGEEENFGPVPDDPMNLPNELNINDNANGNGGDAKDNAEHI